MFEPKARIIYFIIAVELTLAVVLYSILGLRFANISLALPSATFGVMLAAALGSRRLGFPRIATWLEATTLTYLSGLAGWALLFPATVLSLPFADPWLSGIDKALGFNFAALDALVRGWPLDPIYHSFSWEAALVIPLLVMSKRDPWPFVLALTVAMILTYLIFPFAPAMGPRVFYGMIAPDPQTLMISAFRDSGVRTITPNLMVAMVSFPSFHAATAAIFAWAMWPVRVFRWPFLLLNVAVILTTMTQGDHYLIDVLGGLFVAWCAMKLATWSAAQHIGQRTQSRLPAQ